MAYDTIPMCKRLERYMEDLLADPEFAALAHFGDRATRDLAEHVNRCASCDETIEQIELPADIDASEKVVEVWYNLMTAGE